MIRPQTDLAADLRYDAVTTIERASQAICALITNTRAGYPPAIPNTTAIEKILYSWYSMGYWDGKDEGESV